MTDLRIPPHSIESEQAVLGGVMLNNAAWDEVMDRLCETDFYRADHRQIWNAMHQLSLERAPMDAVTVSERLERLGVLDDVGGLAYISNLANDTPSAANIRAYADIIRDKATLRKLIQVGGDITELAGQGEAAQVLVDRAQTMLGELANGVSRSDMPALDSLISGWIEAVDERMHRGGELSGRSTGWPDLDRRLSGLCDGDLVVVAGRPSMGKSALAFQLAVHVSGSAPVAAFSLEMSHQQVLNRFVSCQGRIDHEAIRSGKMTDEQFSKATATANALGRQPLFLDDASGLSVTDIKARARRLHRRSALGLVVIDYLQLVATSHRLDRHDLEIGHITRELKGLAKELRCPVVLLSQLSRSVEQRQNKRPQMADLRDSGSIEQDADVILFPFRPEVYDDADDLMGVTELITAKQRNGPTGTDYLTWLPQYQRFEPMDPESARVYRMRSVRPIRRKGFGGDE